MDHKYCLIGSKFGDIALVWTDDPEIKIKRIFLPVRFQTTDSLAERSFPGVRRAGIDEVVGLAEEIQSFLAGEDIKFDLDMIDIRACPTFQQQVLKAENMIPRGWISTYGRIAWALGKPKNSRAVGNALAKNPFPIVIPCHRAIRSDGSLGGFQGGIVMKQALLEREGIEFSLPGVVKMTRIYY